MVLNASEKLDMLAPALVTAQVKLKNPATDRKADAGKYTYPYLSLPALTDAVRVVFKELGLAFLQEVTPADGGIAVTTRILHLSGQWLDLGPLVLPARGSAQDFGSAITYARRYALAAAVGLAPEEDDDGAKAAKASGSAATRTRSTEPPAPSGSPLSAKGSIEDGGSSTSDDDTTSRGGASSEVAAGSDPTGEGGSGPKVTHVHDFTTEPFQFDGKAIPVRKGWQVCKGCLDAVRAA